MNEILNVRFQGNSIRIVLKDDGIYFVYRDLCRIPGFRSAAERVNGPPVYHRIQTPVYSTMVRLIKQDEILSITSAMRDSGALRQWVFCEIIPEICKRPGCEKFLPRPPWAARKEQQAATAREDVHVSKEEEILNFHLAHLLFMQSIMSVPFEEQPDIIFCVPNFPNKLKLNKGRKA